MISVDSKFSSNYESNNRVQRLKIKRKKIKTDEDEDFESEYELLFLGVSSERWRLECGWWRHRMDGGCVRREEIKECLYTMVMGVSGRLWWWFHKW